MLKQDSAVFAQVRVRLLSINIRYLSWLNRTYRGSIKTPYVSQCFAISFRVLDEDGDDKIMFGVFAGQESSLVEIAALPAHGNGNIEIEFEITRGFDEALELIHILQLRVTV